MRKPCFFIFIMIFTGLQTFLVYGQERVRSGNWEQAAVLPLTVSNQNSLAPVVLTQTFASPARILQSFRPTAPAGATMDPTPGRDYWYTAHPLRFGFAANMPVIGRTGVSLNLSRETIGNPQTGTPELLYGRIPCVGYRLRAEVGRECPRTVSRIRSIVIDFCMNMSQVGQGRMGLEVHTGFLLGPVRDEHSPFIETFLLTQMQPLVRAFQQVYASQYNAALRQQQGGQTVSTLNLPAGEESTFGASSL